MNHPQPEELLPLPEQDESHDDVTGNHIKIPEELGENASNVCEGTLEEGRKTREVNTCWQAVEKSN